MTAGVLDVLIAGKLAGTLSQDGADSLSFAYGRGYRGVPLSSSMPLSTRPYRDKAVRQPTKSSSMLSLFARTTTTFAARVVFSSLSLFLPSAVCQPCG